jgi:hypothetical protein
MRPLERTGYLSVPTAQFWGLHADAHASAAQVHCLKGLAISLLMLTFLIVVAYPPAAAVVVPLFSLIWIIAYLGRQR